MSVCLCVCVCVCVVLKNSYSNECNLRIKATLGQGVLSFIERFPLKCTGIIGIGMSRFVLYREVFFIRSVLYRRFHCIWFMKYLAILQYQNSKYFLSMCCYYFFTGLLLQ